MKKLISKLSNKLKNNMDSINNNDSIFLEDFNLEISRSKHLFFLKSVHFVNALKQKNNAIFYLNDNQKIIIEINNIKAVIETEEDLYILNEIFVEGSYNIITDEPVIFWDIGMNIGLASLFFASMENVKHVLSYEPFKPTFDLALSNFFLNKTIYPKITPHNVGLGDKDESLEVEYITDWKGSIGVNGIPSYRKEGQHVKKEKIKIKKASSIIEDILINYPGYRIIAKIDCEGSEYKIIKDLFNNGKLKHIKAIMMEWHKEGPNELISYLKKSGFTILSFTPHDPNIGMIYAIQVKS